MSNRPMLSTASITITAESSRDKAEKIMKSQRRIGGHPTAQRGYRPAIRRIPLFNRCHRHRYTSRMRLSARPISLAASLLLSCSLTAMLRAAEPAYPAEHWSTVQPAEVGLDADKLKRARDYALTGEGSGVVTR